MPTHPFTQVDVFADRPWGGNPVAIVHDADDLDPGQMQAIARWLDLSETVFLQQPADAHADYQARIFTPAEELPFAGHPTLGACAAWLAAGGRPADEARIVQRCAAGDVELRVHDDRIGFVGPPLRRDDPLDADERARAAAVLGVEVADLVAAAWADNGPGWVAVELRDAAAVLAVRADVRRDPLGGAWYLGLVGASTDDGADHDLDVRALFPDSSGALREDPATGSLAASVGRWFAQRGRLEAGTGMVLRQGTEVGADARLHVHRDAQDRIWVTGTTRVRVTGHLEV